MRRFTEFSSASRIRKAFDAGCDDGVTVDGKEEVGEGVLVRINVEIRN